MSGSALAMPRSPAFVRKPSSSRPGSGEEARNRFEAVIEVATDLGEVKEIHLTVGSWQLRSRVPASMTLEAGQRAAIEILAERCTIVPP